MQSIPFTLTPTLNILDYTLTLSNMRLTILFCLAIGLLCSCEPNGSGELDLPDTASPCSDINKIEVTTGLQFNDLQGAAIRSWKVPNDVTATEVIMRAFPNPAINNLKIYSELPFTDFWFVPANCPNECTRNYITEDDITGSELDEDELIIKSEFLGRLSQSTSNFEVDISSVPMGTYKLFLRLEDGSIVWQNILKISEPMTTEAILKYLKNGCI